MGGAGEEVGAEVLAVPVGEEGDEGWEEERELGVEEGREERD